MSRRRLQTFEADARRDRNQQFTIQVLPDLPQQLQTIDRFGPYDNGVCLLHKLPRARREPDPELISPADEVFRMTIDHQHFVRRATVRLEHSLDERRCQFSET